MMLSDASRAQNRASSPAGSAWVGANAGSGKTRVLTDRVARLLLHGASPQRILCLTYTKAAAAEMKNRLFRRLGAWSMMPDAELRAELAQLEETGDVDLAVARRLFADALETPGELKIQTIHAFCGTILRRFPMEAGISPGFREMDDRATLALRADLMDEIAVAAPDVFAAMAAHCPGDGPEGLLNAILSQRDAFATPFDRAKLEADLGIRADDPVPQVFGAEERDLLDRLAHAMRAAGTPNEKNKQLPKVLSTLTTLTAEQAESFLLYDKKTEKRDHLAKIDKFATKQVVATLDPADVEALNDLAMAVEAARSDRIARAVLERTQALHDFAAVFLERYDAAKAAQGMLDFEDLILRTRDLLRESDMAPWVLYKLDGGIDHILVDEAQDTSPRQWDVIEALTPEFYAGQGVERDERTLFVVGDEKQSIYSFQGAQPDEFKDMREKFRDRLGNAGKPFGEVALDVSFRSAAPILSLVDEVFAPANRGGVDDKVAHAAFDDAKPGRVDLWPFLETEKDTSEALWWLPVDTPPSNRADLQLARHIAAEVARMLASGTQIPGEDGPRPLAAGDILILLRSRGPLFHGLIGHLKDHGVPVAGADRVKLGGELAVRDLLALMHFAVTPDDDLSLAAALRSPLFDVDEDALFRLAHGRGRTRLLARLQDDPRHSDAARILQEIRDDGDFTRPFEFLDRILTRRDGRRRFIARLGPPAAEGLDELLAQALAYERTEPPTLTGFLDWLEPDSLDIKRELGQGGDAVRVMTIHGAKGLEAPVVILPDTAQRNRKSAPPVLPRDKKASIWQASPNSDLEAEAVTAHKARDDREQERLLYVALTRAEHWLIVAGAGTRGSKDNPAWYEMVEQGMQDLTAAHHVAPDGMEGSMLRLESRWPTSTASPAVVPVARPKVIAPDWGLVPAPVEDRLISPSKMEGAHALPGEGEETARALLRGDVTHALLDLPRGVEDPTAGDLLARLPSDMQDEVAREVRNLRETPALAPLFCPEAMSEVPISGNLGGRPVFGRVDRIVREGDRILIVDFKSNRVVPDRPDQTPEALLRQMAVYRAVLAPGFPGKQIDVAIVWTAVARMDVLPQEIVSAALLRAGFS